MTAGSTAEVRASSKVEYYACACQKRAWAFVALVGETTGAFNQAGERFVRKLTRAQALRTEKTS